MLYNFEEIETHTSNLGGIIGKMEQHTQHVVSVQRDLMDSGFFGSAASGYDSVVTEITTRLENYKGSLDRLKGAIGTASNDMQLVDTNNGRGFAGIL
ncbi:WXG100 family type VII secretion target [Nocardia sp. NPDC052001]|uniref:WXG100 family type VII secretion target n=1 Tax=Nocardia sp. NPDC052001 TaxID=3154853 RepID=UPI00341C1813